MTDYVALSLFALSIALVPVKKAFKKTSVNPHQARVSCISAPGKVLIAGGYLVLEHPNLGVSVATSSRFYTTVKAQALAEDIPTFANSITIVVDSAQFYQKYVYSYNVRNGLVTPQGSAKNEFVEKCLSLTMAFVGEFKEKDGSTMGPIVKALEGTHYLSITLQAHNDFYSQIQELKRRGLPLLSSSLLQLPKFLPCPRDDHGNIMCAKTGLGSSAALTTSLVSALLQWFEVTRVGLRPDQEDRRVAHNLSQLVHAAAQGKIGSGFDVAAAVYGTQMYRRFDAARFEPCMEPDCSPALLYSAVMSEGEGAAIPTTASVNALLDARSLSQRKQQTIRPGGWSQTIRPFDLPYGMDLVLGDVCGGSQSPSMARQVLAWRFKNEHERAASIKTSKEMKEIRDLWSDLGDANAAIFDTIEEMNRQHSRDPLKFNADVAWASERTAAEWKADAVMSNSTTIQSLLKLNSLFRRTRTLLKTMGDKAGVGVEPDAQTALCDATMELPGVVAAGVPGAGGNDAVFALILSDAARARVEKMWSQWGNATNPALRPPVCPLVLHAGKGLKAGIVGHFGGSQLI